MRSLNPSKLARIVATLLSLLASTIFLASMVQAQTAADSVAPAGLLPGEPDSETIPSGKTPGEVLDGRANLLRHYEPTRMLRVVFALKPRNWERHQQLLDDLHDKQSPLFHQFLTAEEWNARFAPAPEDEQALADWAQSQGFTITQRFPNRLLVCAEAQAGAIETALHLTINHYRLPAEEGEQQGRIVFSNDRDPQLPSRLEGVVRAVIGLNSIERVEPALRQDRMPEMPDYVPGPAIQKLESLQADAPDAERAESADAPYFVAENIPAPPANSNTPSIFWSTFAYDYQGLMNLGHCCNPLKAPKGSPKETTIALATFGDVLLSDVTGFATQFKLAANIQKLAINGVYTCSSTADPNCGETTLDTEWATATANSQGLSQNTAQVIVYEASSSSIATTMAMYEDILNDNTSRVMSTSWSCVESTASGKTGCTKDTILAWDTTLASMVAQGWTLLGDSGDQGATGGCSNALLVRYPASDPNMVAVGGTSLNEGTTSSTYEVAWTGSTATGSCGKNSGGSTGGFSELFTTAPSYQAYLGFKKRAVPDIALDAAHGHDTFLNGQWTFPGGTSVATPIMAGFIAQENAYLLSLGSICGAGTAPCAPLGNADYPMYQEAQYNDSEHNPFYDIVSGCNSNDITALYKLTAYCAGTGYDEVTGLGSANMMQLAWSINLHLTAAGGRPYVTFSGPKKNKWYNTSQIVKWKINDYSGPGNLPGTGVAGFTQGWDWIPTDPATEAHGGNGNLFYNGPEFANTSVGCLALAGGTGCQAAEGQGCHWAYVHGWNNQGESTAGQTGYPEAYGPICYDSVPPVTVSSLSPLANGQGWSNKPTTVTITATDPGGNQASGIAGIEFAVNAACVPHPAGSLNLCKPYASPIAFTRDGIYTVQYYSVDKAGNFDNDQFDYIRVMLDQTPPVTTAKIYGTRNTSSFVSNVNLTLQATDNLSLVQYTQYQIDGGPAKYYDIGSTPLNLIPVAGVGTHTFKYWSSDTAGNLEIAHTLTFIIAKGTATTLTASPNTALLGQQVILKATVVDPLTGTTPTGTIKFFNGATQIAWLTLVNGQASLAYPFSKPGSYSLTAAYQGAAGFPASTSPAIVETAGKLQQTTIALIQSSANQSVAGKPVTFTVRVTAAISGLPTGALTFMDGTTKLGTGTYSAQTGAWTLTTSALAAGTHSITADYGGSTVYAPCTSPVLAQKVSAAGADPAVSVLD